jgi:glycosyltransferase involved in cell wall biosynthesis
MAEVPGAALVVVGDGPLRADLESLAARSDARIVFTGLRHDARAIIGAADIVLLTSRWEGLPLVVLEALSAGRPVVGPAIPPLTALVTSEVNALLVAPDGPGAFAAALNRLLADPSLAAALGAAGRDVAAQHTDEAMVRSYLALYDEVAAGH